MSNVSKYMKQKHVVDTMPKFEIVNFKDFKPEELGSRCYQGRRTGMCNTFRQMKVGQSIVIPFSFKTWKQTGTYVGMARAALRTDKTKRATTKWSRIPHKTNGVDDGTVFTREA